MTCPRRVILCIKSVYANQGEENQAQNKCFLSLSISHSAYEMLSLNQKQSGCSVYLLLQSLNADDSSLGTCMGEVHELENLPPLLFTSPLLTLPPPPTLYMRGNLPEIFGEISASVECSLGHNSRKGKELNVPHELSGALYVAPLLHKQSWNNFRPCS